MGLFGGFKAKFTRNNNPKSKPQEVVCLRYHIHSEFDAQDQPLPIKFNNNITRNEVVRSPSKKKERKTLVKSAIFPGPSSPNPTALKSLSLTNLTDDSSTSIKQPNGRLELNHPATISTTFTLPSNGKSTIVSDTTFKKTVEEHRGIVTEKVAIVTNNDLYTTDHNVTKEEHNQTILTRVSNHATNENSENDVEYMSNAEMSFLKPSWTYENSVQENGLTDLSTLISMTQHSSRSSSIDRDYSTFTKKERSPDCEKHLESSDITDDHFNFSFVPGKAVSDDEIDSFKVNVVKHDLSRSYSYSEDEHSHEEEEEPRFTRMGYSSQAASIFFGEGQEAEVTRPRKIQLTDDDDDRRSSGADC